MIDKWREGYEVVYGVRSSRRENILKKMCYAGFYRLLKAIADIEIALDAGDFSLMDRKVVDLLNDMPEHNRFIRGMRGWLGFRQIGISYARDERAAGSSKYEFMRLLKLAMDGIISFSTLPLRISSVLGFGMALVGFLYALYVVIYHVVSGNSPTGWSSMVFLILVFGGIQLIVLGIMGEYISRIYDESRKRPLYIVSTICGSINERRERSAQV
jgi:polyisoprenyl-phosphate glycosyltransferase